MLNLGGRTEPIFTDAAISKIHELSGGVPRQINRVCDLALLAAATEELPEVTDLIVESVYKELNADMPAPLSIAV
jgi:type II secretory pathway predicted ATPase ExeA